MNKGRLFLILSSAFVFLMMSLVVLTNAIPVPAFASARDSDTATLRVKKIVVETTFKDRSLAEKMIRLGEDLIGTPYHYAGRSQATGFDCSGFTHYIFGQVGIELSPASKEQIFAGKQVKLSQVRKGDLLVFTGTNLSIREPGHVGIVITKYGEHPVKFVHSSSVGGVKISQVDSTRYADRLLQVRRLLN